MATKTITIPREEYHDLVMYRDRFENLQKMFAQQAFRQPPVRSRLKVVSALKQSGKYSKAFLDSVSKGLQESTYFTR